MRVLADKLREVQGIWLSQGFTFTTNIDRMSNFFVQRENGLHNTPQLSSE